MGLDLLVPVFEDIWANHRPASIRIKTNESINVLFAADK